MLLVDCRQQHLKSMLEHLNEREKIQKKARKKVAWNADILECATQCNQHSDMTWTTGKKHKRSRRHRHRSTRFSHSCQQNPARKKLVTCNLAFVWLELRKIVLLVVKNKFYDFVWRPMKWRRRNVLGAFYSAWFGVLTKDWLDVFLQTCLLLCSKHTPVIIKNCTKNAPTCTWSRQVAFVF